MLAAVFSYFSLHRENTRIEMAVEVIYDDWLSLRMRLTADIFASKVSGVGFTDKIIQFFFLPCLQVQQHKCPERT